MQAEVAGACHAQKLNLQTWLSEVHPLTPCSPKSGVLALQLVLSNRGCCFVNESLMISSGGETRGCVVEEL